jgi:hypothetical protein
VGRFNSAAPLLGAKATSVTGGEFNAEKETVTVVAFSGHAKIKAIFA